jgi:hypothetical protein
MGTVLGVRLCQSAEAECKSIATIARSRNASLMWSPVIGAFATGTRTGTAGPGTVRRRRKFIGSVTPGRNNRSKTSMFDLPRAGRGLIMNGTLSRDARRSRILCDLRQAKKTSRNPHSLDPPRAYDTQPTSIIHGALRSASHSRAPGRWSWCITPTNFIPTAAARLFRRGGQNKFLVQFSAD